MNLRARYYNLSNGTLVIYGFSGLPSYSSWLIPGTYTGIDYL